MRARNARKSRVDFFISYTRVDEQWAEWIAWTLNQAGYSHYFQKWHFKVGGDFVQHMHEALLRSGRLLMVLTPDYLNSLFAQSEWTAAFANDPTGEKGILFPVRVRDVELEGLLKTRIYLDLVGLGPTEARNRLVAALRTGAHGRPKIAPAFPIDAVPARARTSNTYDGNFPGPSRSAAAPRNATRAAALELKSIFDTTRTAFEAQSRLRDLLVRHLETRLRIRQKEEYEPFFERHFARFDAEELRLHRTMRSYTEAGLAKYNARARELLSENPALSDALPSSFSLRQHLDIWLNKFSNVFLVTPSMCLVYVGVEERFPFPSRIEGELARFLSGRKAPRPKRRATSRESD
jgi:hypothetical protein